MAGRGLAPAAPFPHPEEAQWAGVDGSWISWIAARQVALKRGAPSLPSFHVELLEAQRTECLMTSFKYSDIPMMKGLNATAQGPAILEMGVMTSALNSACLSGTLSA